MNDQMFGGVKFDSGKARMDLVPPEAIWALAKTLERGAQKYDERNWEKGLAYSRVYAAAVRHLLRWWGGRDTDLDSGLPHLWHALTNLAFLVTFEERGAGLDDRPRRDTVDRPFAAPRGEEQ